MTDPNKDLFGPKPAKSEDNVVQFPNVKSDSPDNALLSDLAAITKLKRQLAVSPSKLDAFKLMNRHHATITIEQKFYIIQELNTINLITEETLIKQFRNCKFSFGDDKPISIAILWLNSGSRRECDEFVCDPKTVYNPESPIFNKFRGFGTQAVKGDCSLILDYFKNDVCSAKDKRYHFVMSWCSHMFQKPWEKPEVAFALTGPKGIGKSLFFWILKRLLDGKSRAGRALKYYHKVSKSKGLLPRFNVHLEENILLVSEEVSFIGDKELIGSINDFITSDTLTVEIKNGPIRDVNSYSRLGITLNDEHIVPASPDERRYAVFKVSDARQGQKAYFKAIINQLNNSGAEALMYEFMHYDISDFDPRQNPDTDELGSQKIDSFVGVTLWWYNKLCSGRLPLFERLTAGHNGPCKIVTERLQNDYFRSEKDPWLRTTFSKESFGKQLRKLCPAIKKGDKISNSSAYNVGSKANWIYVYTIPPLPESRAAFERNQNVRNIEWDDSITEWDGDLIYVVDAPF